MAEEIESSSLAESITRLIEGITLGIELLAVAIIVVAIITATVAYLLGGINRARRRDAYETYKERLGRGLLLGLEILVAADVVRTAALESSLTNVAVLAMLVVIRTFLSWSLVVEIEHRWPWQAERGDEHPPESSELSREIDPS